MSDEEFDKALKRANKLIKFRLRSKWELTHRLLDAGFHEIVVEKVVSELEKKGIINDKKFAKLYADQMLNVDGYGPFRIKMKLKELRIDEEIIENVIRDLLREYDIPYVMRKILATHRVENSKAREYLFRRGFTPDLIDLLDLETGGADE